MAKKDEYVYGQVPLPQVTKETVERNARDKALKQPPTMAAAIPQATKETAERNAREKAMRKAPSLEAAIPNVLKETVERNAQRRALEQPPTLAAVVPQVTKQESKAEAEREAREKALQQPPTLEAPLTQGRPYRMFKVFWGGLNKVEDIDTGQLSSASNIDTSKLPYLIPSKKPVEITAYYHESTNDTTIPPTTTVDGDSMIYYPYQSVSGASGYTKIHKKPLGMYAAGDALNVIFSGQVKEASSGTTRYYDRGFVETVDIDDSNTAKSISKAKIDDGRFDALQYDAENIPPHMTVGFNTYGDTPNITAVTVSQNTLVSPTFVSMPGSGGVVILDWKVSEGGERTVSRGSTRDGGYTFTNKYEGKLVRLIIANTGTYIWSKVTCAYDGANKLQSVTYTEHSRGGTEYTAGTVTGAPEMDYITVHQSRLFGVGNNRVYASEYNDYAGWTLDTSGEINESNAWMSTSQSNPRAAGDFTGIATYQNHVLLFRKRFLQEVYGTKNPFRIVDIGEYGTIDQRSICEVDGVLYFVGDNAIYSYNGSTARIISDSLDIDHFTYAVAGGRDHCYYLCCVADGELRLLVYDTRNKAWCERDIKDYAAAGETETIYGDPCEKIVCFANISQGLYALTCGGRIFLVDGDYMLADSDNDGVDDAYDSASWSFETELITRHNLTSSYSASAMAYSNVNIKHLKKIQLMADVTKRNILLNDDFTDYADTSALFDVWTRTTEDATLDVSKALKISASNTLCSVARELPNVPCPRTVTIRFKFCYEHQSANPQATNIKIYCDETSIDLLKTGNDALRTGNNIRIVDETSYQYFITSNTWYTAEVDYNTRDGAYKIAIIQDGVVVATAKNNNAPKLNKITKFTVSKLQPDWGYEEDGVLSIDDISITRSPVPGFKVYLLYDDEEFNNSMTPVYDSNGEAGRVVARMKLRNTAHYGVRLHVEGTGYVKLYDMELYVESGGELYLDEDGE